MQYSFSKGRAYTMYYITKLRNYKQVDNSVEFDKLNKLFNHLVDSSCSLKASTESSRKSSVMSQDNSFHDFAVPYEQLLFRKLVFGFGSANFVVLLLRQYSNR